MVVKFAWAFRKISINSIGQCNNYIMALDIRILKLNVNDIMHGIVSCVAN